MSFDRKILKPQYRRRGMVRSAVLSVLVLIVLAGGAWLLLSGVLGGGDSDGFVGDTPQWDEVRFERIPITVIAEGDLVAKDSTDIVNIIEHRDDERIKQIVEEGSWVEQGDFLYELSAPGLVTDHEDAVAKVREGEAELDEAKANLEIEVDTAASEDAKAELAVELAHLAHKQWEQGTHRQKLNDLDLAIKKAKRELDIATRELDFSKELFEQDFISRTELEQDEIRLEEAEYAVQTAELDVEVYNNYEKVKSEKEMLSDIKQAEEELERTRSKNKNKLKLLEAKVKTQESELEQRKTQMLEYARMREAMVVEAPIAGLVLYSSTIGSRRERWYPMRKGAEVRGGWRVMVITNTKEMLVNLYVHESRINDIEPGQRVAVTVNARPDKVYMATIIEKKNSAMQESSTNPHLRQYQVIAEMPPGLSEDIRPGMNCSAEIFVREIPQALAVPIQSVHTVGDKHYVYVKAPGNKIRRQPIEIGGSSDTLVQIKSGLEEGTSVLLRNPLPGEVLRDNMTEDDEALAAEPESEFPTPVSVSEPTAADRPQGSGRDGEARGQGRDRRQQGGDGGERPGKQRPQKPVS